MMARDVAQPRGIMASWTALESLGSSMATASEILVVDDEPDLCEIVAEYLGRHGFVVYGSGWRGDGGASPGEAGRSRDPRHQYARRGRAYPRPPAAGAQRRMHHDVDSCRPDRRPRGRTGDGRR